ncbi:hypothetical protein ACFVT5_10875 [Streptomyces sp. NPDC058001]|uniref:hypothetical protein n=1 Tax=Streptomyces sp. NPDC058001 TaxID=3346300 RepID=UPI0036E4F5A5
MTGLRETAGRVRRTVVAAWAVTDAVGRRVGRYLWPRSRGNRNRAYLRDRLIALPLLGVVSFGAFAWGYGELRGDSAYVREQLAPALADLADAKVSLRIAQEEAVKSLGNERAVELGGLSERYRNRLSRASQDLGQVAQSGALTVSQRQELQVVSGLLTDYSGWISRAQAHGAKPVLRMAELSYAQGMLCSPATTAEAAAPDTTENLSLSRCAPKRPPASQATTVVDRISGLEEQLRDQLGERAAWGPRVLTAGAVSAVGFALFAYGLWHTFGFLRRRFRITLSLPLLVAAVPLVLIPFLTVDGILAQRAQHAVQSTVRDLTDRTLPKIETDTENEPFDAPDPLSVARLTGTMDRRLAAGGTPGPELAWLAPFVFPAGLVTAAVTAGALHGYRREYLTVTRHGAVI